MATYVVQRSGSEPREEQIKFNGLFPGVKSFDAAYAIHLDGYFELFREAFGQPSYLGPFRVETTYDSRMPNQMIKDSGPRGEHAFEMLADDKLRRGGYLSTSVSAWFASAMNQDFTVEVELDRCIKSKIRSGLKQNFEESERYP